jgi:hypothetical protein
MIEFPVYASNFEVFPREGEAFQHLGQLLGAIKRINFTLRVKDPSANSGEMVSDFDDQLEQVLLTNGAKHLNFRLPPEIPQELDFAFEYAGKTVAVEIEKTNREKILRDILKCHMYLHAGADMAIIGLPNNYSHSNGVWNLFKFGTQRLSECKNYGFGTEEKLGKILLLGYDQFEALNNQPLSQETRQRMRREVTDQSHQPSDNSAKKS